MHTIKTPRELHVISSSTSEVARRGGQAMDNSPDRAEFHHPATITTLGCIAQPDCLLSNRWLLADAKFGYTS